MFLLFFLPICIGVGRIWWIFFIISIAFAFVGVFFQQMFRQNFFYQQLEHFLTQQSFDVVDEQNHRVFTRSRCFGKEYQRPKKEVEQMNVQIDLHKIFSKTQREKATNEQLATLTFRSKMLSFKKNIYQCSCTDTRFSKTQ